MLGPGWHVDRAGAAGNAREGGASPPDTQVRLTRHRESISSAEAAQSGGLRFPTPSRGRHRRRRRRRCSRFLPPRQVDASKGRSVIASRRFAAGEVVLSDEPYAFALVAEQLATRCDCGCLEPVAQALR